MTILRGRRNGLLMVSLFALLAMILAACGGSSVDTDDMPKYQGAEEIGKAEASDEDTLDFEASDGKGVVLKTKDTYETVIGAYGTFNADGWVASGEPVDAGDQGFVELVHAEDSQIALVLVTTGANVKANSTTFDADDFDIDLDEDVAEDDTVIYIVQVKCDEDSIDACTFTGGV